ncbi:MAG: hypothetical protein ACLP7F_17185 [Acidimicrobiales bacterium]
MDGDPGATGLLAPHEGPAAPMDQGEGPPTGRRYRGNGRWLSGGAFSPPSSAQVSTAVHGATLVGAFAFWAWLDRGLWFFGDEWDFLVRRGLFYAPGSHRSIWSAHNEHWSTLPILLWRGLFNLFHLSTYWPYLVPLLLAQVVVMHLVWRLCRRAGVDTWVATAAVGVLGFLGAGVEDLSSAFQIGFVASVLFGLVAFDLLDRPAGDPPTPPTGRAPLLDGGRRQVLASLALLASLMCSTVGDAMVIGAAVLVFAHRSPRRALGVLALPVASYVVWFAFLGRPSVSAPGDQFALTTFTTLPGYVWSGLYSSLDQAFNLAGAGAALLVGLAAWVLWHMRALWRQCPSLLGLGVAAAMFFVLVGLGRDTTAGATTVVTRYVYVAVALLLPMVAKVLGTVATWPAGRWAMVALLAVTALGNVGQAEAYVPGHAAVTSGLKDQLVATAHLLVAGVADVSGPGASPIGLYPDLSVASIEHLARSGLLPRTVPTPADLTNARALLALGTWDGSKTALLAQAPFPGRFAFVRAVDGATSVQANGCLDFGPETISPPMQVWLRVPPGQQAASVRLSAAPASPGVANYVAALLVPPGGPASTSPVQLLVPADGTGYLSDNEPRSEVVVLWDVGTPLQLCGLSRRPGPR